MQYSSPARGATIVYVDREAVRKSEVVALSDLARRVRDVKPHFQESSTLDNAIHLLRKGLAAGCQTNYCRSLTSALAEIITKVNDLFEGDLTPDDQLVYVNSVLKGKLLESDLLVQQAVSNTKEQFATSGDLKREHENAIIEALAAHTTMSKQALESARVQAGLLEILLGPGQLWEALRAKGTATR